MWTRGSPTTTDTPVVDVERLLTDYAWKEIAEPTCYQRMMKDQKYKLEVDWNFLDISHEVTSFDPSNVVHRNLCLFRTEFVNESNEAQNFTFKTERTTTSKCEVSLLYGLRRGKSVEFRISIPPVAACRLTGGLSGELTLSETTNQTFEEHLAWSVDSQVKVERRSRTVASLMIREEEVNATIKLDTVIKARQNQVPIYIKHKKTGKQIKRTWLESNILGSVLNSSCGFEKIDDCTVKRESKGIVRLVYGAEQVIDLKTIPLGSDIMQFTEDQLRINTGVVNSLEC